MKRKKLNEVKTTLQELLGLDLLGFFDTPEEDEDDEDDFGSDEEEGF